MRDTAWLLCNVVPTRTHSSGSFQWPSSSHCLHIHELLIFWSMRPSSARRHIETMTNWHVSAGTHAEFTHTHTHPQSPVTVLESTKEDDPRASSGPRRSLVWQICLTLRFLHNSPYYGPKWPAWSPWISMSSVSVCVNSARFDACRQLGR